MSRVVPKSVAPSFSQLSRACPRRNHGLRAAQYAALASRQAGVGEETAASQQSAKFLSGLAASTLMSLGVAAAAHATGQSEVAQLEQELTSSFSVDLGGYSVDHKDLIYGVFVGQVQDSPQTLEGNLFFLPDDKTELSDNNHAQREVFQLSFETAFHLAERYRRSCAQAPAAVLK